MSFTKRLTLPIAVAALIALTVGFGPALMARAGPSLPPVSPKQLLVNVQQSDVEGVSGVVDLRSELGLPEMPTQQGGSPHDNGTAPRELLTGTHTLRVDSAGPERQRVEILGELSQYTLIRNGRDAWAYDSAENSGVHWRLPDSSAHRGEAQSQAPQGGGSAATPRDVAQYILDEVGPSTKLDVQGTDQVAGRDVYTLSLAPRGQDSLVERAAIYVDAENWAPLRVTVTPRDGGEPAVDVGFREVDFGEPPASRFQFSPPEGADITQKSVPPHGKASPHGKGSGAGGDGSPQAGPQRSGSSEVIGSGWTSVLKVEGVRANTNRGWLARSGTPVSGEFGDGKLVTTRLVTALVTEDGRLYVGAVTPETIKEAASES